MLAVDTETTGFSWYDDAFLATVCNEEGISTYYELPSQQDSLIERLVGERLVFHNAKYDLQKLIRAGVLTRQELTADRIEDTECAAHLLWPHRIKRLKILAKDILGLETDEAIAISKAKKDYQKQYKKDTGSTIYSKDIGYHLLPREVVIPYALKDAEFTWALYERLKPMLDDTLIDLYKREMELTLVLLDIEAAGMAVNIEYIDREIKIKNSEILLCELNIADQTGLKVWYPERSGQKTPEGCLNPNSVPQMQEVFRGRGIELENTQEATLKVLDDTLAKSIIDLRGYKKLLGTYLLGIKHDQRDGVIHPAYPQHRAKTGRMTSASNTGD